MDERESKESSGAAMPEFLAVAALFAALRVLPRGLSRGLGAILARGLMAVAPGWRRNAEANLKLAFPGMTQPEREKILRAAPVHWGRMLAEFARFPRTDSRNVDRIVEYDGLEHFERAAAQGKGVLFLTAHLGGWELSSFAHSLYGHPLAYLNRPIDNPHIDRLVNRYRCLGGNRSIDRTNAARLVLEELRAGGAVGFLLDQNVVDGHGNVFAEFFGVPASTSSGLARFAMKTGAPVVPGFAVWEEEKRKYVLRFESPVELADSGNEEADVIENTRRFNCVIERAIRRYPDQWLWVHRRWRTRPPGEAPLYGE